MVKKSLSIILCVLIWLCSSLIVYSQGNPQGKSQDAPLDGSRTGFAPTASRFTNLVPQDVTSWASLPGQAIVTTGLLAPDGTTAAAQLSTVWPPVTYKRLYGASRTINVGDWIIFGVWVKAISMQSNFASQPLMTLFGETVAQIQLWDPTENFQLDIDLLSSRNIRTSTKADTQWEWVTTAARVVLAPSDAQGELRVDLICSDEHTLAFYAPVLFHIPVGQITNDEATGLLQNLYPIPDGVNPGTLALLWGQNLHLQGGAFSLRGLSSSPSLSTAGSAKMYVDSNGRFKCSENGGAYSNCVGGGGLSPGVNWTLTDGSNPSLTFTTGTAASRVQQIASSVMIVGTDTLHSLIFRTSGNDAWQIDTLGNFRPVISDALDIGSSSFVVRDIYIGSNIWLGRPSAETGLHNFYNSVNSNVVTVKAGTTAANWSFILPTADGVANTYLKTDGTGQTSFAPIARVISVDNTARSNTGTGETDLTTFSVQANTLSNNGEHLEIEVAGSTAANANNKQFRIYFGGSVFFDSGNQALNNKAWRAWIRIFRTGPTAVRITCSFVTENVVFQNHVNTTLSPTLSSANIFKVTGTGGGSNDITQNVHLIIFHPAQ